MVAARSTVQGRRTSIPVVTTMMELSPLSPNDEPHENNNNNNNNNNQSMSLHNTSSLPLLPVGSHDSQDDNINVHDNNENDISWVLKRLLEVKEQNLSSWKEEESLQQRLEEAARKQDLSVSDLMAGMNRPASPNHSLHNSNNNIMDESFVSLNQSFSRSTSTSLTGSPTTGTTTASSSKHLTKSQTKRKKRKSLIEKTTKFLHLHHSSKASSSPKRRQSQPEIRTPLKEFLDQQISQRSLERELMALKHEKQTLESKLHDSGTITTSLTDLVDVHALEMEKLIATCQKQKQTIDHISKDRDRAVQQRHDSLQELDHWRQTVQTLQHDKKQLRKQLKEVSVANNSKTSKPPPILEQETQELLYDFLVQDEEAFHLIDTVGPDVAHQEAYKIVQQTSPSLGMAKLSTPKITNKSSTKTAKDTLLDSETKSVETQDSVEVTTSTPANMDAKALQKQLTTANKVCAKLKDELASSRSSFQKLLKETKAELEDAKLAKQKLQEQLDKRSEEMVHLVNKNQSLQATIQSQETMFSQQTLELEDMRRSLTAESETFLQASREEINDLRQQLHSQTTMVQKCETKIQQQHESLEKLQLQKDEVEWQSEYQKTELKRLKVVKEKLEQELATTKTTNSALQQDALNLGEYITELALLKETEVQNRAALDSLRQTVNSQASEIAMFHTTCEDYEQQITRLKTQLQQQHQTHQQRRWSPTTDGSSTTLDVDDYATALSYDGDSLTLNEPTSSMSSHTYIPKDNGDNERAPSGAVVGKSQSLATGTLNDDDHTCGSNEDEEEDCGDEDATVDGDVDDGIEDAEKPMSLSIMDVQSLGTGVVGAWDDSTDTLPTSHNKQERRSSSCSLHLGYREEVDEECHEEQVRNISLSNLPMLPSFNDGRG